MATVHAVLGASSAKRWFNCPGSINFVKNQPPSHLDQGSDFADEGTEAHELAEECLKNGYDAAERTDNPDLAEAVQVYLDEVRFYMDMSLDPELHVEDKFQINMELFGTNDALIFDKVSKDLYVFDYKHGAGVPVDAEENLQLSYYALGAMKSLGLKPETIHLCVVQPRCYLGGVKFWTAPKGYIEQFEKELFEAVDRVKAKDAPLSAGGHCHFCPGLAVCPAYRSKIIQSTEYTLLSENYKIGEYLGKWKAAIDRVVYKALMNGDKVPGLKLVEKKVHRKWKDDKALAKELSDNKEAFKPGTLKTPAQLEKLLGKAFVAEKAFKPKADLTVALESDKRPAWSKAQKDFEDVEI